MNLAEANAPAQATGRDAILAEGRRVLLHEAEALECLAGVIDADFVRAVEALLTVRGKVIVSGMGKSGHIGGKIAATLASTGTPSFFVHPAEAAHGDLGMIGPEDAVLMLSNSGESVELMQIALHARKLGLVSIAITARPGSRLGQAAGIVLAILDIPEACPSNIAPSSSTTMALALGDALALTLMRERDFGRVDFARLHPGGKLGLRLSRVAELMQRGDALPLVSDTASAHATILEMTTKRLGATGVINAEGQLVGVITDGDLRRSFERPQDWQARDIMTREPVTIDGETNAEEALALMHDRAVSILFVFNADAPDTPAGVVHLHQFVGLGLG